MSVVFKKAYAIVPPVKETALGDTRNGTAES